MIRFPNGTTKFGKLEIIRKNAIRYVLCCHRPTWSVSYKITLVISVTLVTYLSDPAVAKKHLVVKNNSHDVPQSLKRRPRCTLYLIDTFPTSVPHSIEQCDVQTLTCGTSLTSRVVRVSSLSSLSATPLSVFAWYAAWSDGVFCAFRFFAGVCCWLCVLSYNVPLLLFFLILLISCSAL